MTPSWTDIVSCLSAAAAALAAIAIPLVLAWWARRQQAETDRRERQSRAFAALDGLNRDVSESVSKLVKLCPDASKLTYDNVLENSEVERHVFDILNGYEYLCHGANEGLFARGVVETLRGSAISQTRKQYGAYISGYRKQRDPDAWIQIDRFLEGGDPVG